MVYCNAKAMAPRYFVIHTILIVRRPPLFTLQNDGPHGPTPVLVPVTLTSDFQIRRLRNDTRKRLSLPLDLPSTCTYRRPDDGVRTHALD